MMTSQDLYFDALAKERRIRIRVVGICIDRGQLLYQRSVDDPDGPIALPGGGLELGATLEEQLAQEISEETTATLVAADYLFVVENQFTHKDNPALFHQVEHYFEIKLDTHHVQTREAHLEFGWLSLTDLATADLRPHVVRDEIASGRLHETRHLIQTATT